MAGVIVDVLVERLVTFALDKIQREINLASGVKQEIKKIKKKLQAIQAVLEDAEQRQVMEASVKLWLNELNDVSFDMDHVLDEWITKVQMHQQKKQEDEGALETTSAAKKKVCFPCLPSCFRFGKVDYQLFLRSEIAHKIVELNERLASIDLNKQSFTLANNPRVAPDLSNRIKTTSLPNVKTFGRDSEKELILSKLLNEGSEGNVVPLIIPIVGLGGMGKTSLANLVYNDDQIKNHFDKSIWVCVSDPFEEIKIARAIVEGLEKENSLIKSVELEALLKEISRLIKGEKFLLVLDDVWSPNYKQWEELSKPLCQGAIGSRVLVTTRNEKVANVMKATTQMIRLKELNESFCLSLFYYNADMDESRVSREYSVIGLKLVRKCKGLPLAAKSLGRLMSTKKPIHEWRAVLNSKIWELEGIQEDVFQPLMLSYQNLDLAVKRCLLYCVLFPKGHMYDKITLIELWMSQDYLNAHGSEKSLTTGQNYFDELAKLSFFQDLEVIDDNRWSIQPKIRCKIHDIVHDFLQNLTKNEYLILGDGETEVQSGKARHLSIAFRNDIKPLVSILSNCKKLRSCSLKVSTEDNSSIGPILELIQGVRTLSLFLYERKGIPETMSRLIHLRYLDLSENRKLEELPRDVMGGLYNLQTLRLVGCDELKKVYVGGLVNLKHLYVEECRRLFLEGVEKLTRLQTLDWFCTGESNDGNKMEHLRDLNQLQGSLKIRISKLENNTTKIMVNKAHLLDLNLWFSVIESTSEEPVATYEDTMESLEPHPNLERLFLCGYKGNRFSNWLSSLHSLTSLILTTCEVREISPLGKLKSLERLQMNGLGLERMGVEFLGIEETSLSSNFISFPKLTHLRMILMSNLEIWEGVKEEDNYNKITIMPCLTHLEIGYCNELEALPDFLWETPLQKLEIIGCRALKKLYREEDGEQRSKISHIPNIRIQQSILNRLRGVRMKRRLYLHLSIHCLQPPVWYATETITGGIPTSVKGYLNGQRLSLATDPLSENETIGNNVKATRDPPLQSVEETTVSYI